MKNRRKKSLLGTLVIISLLIHTSCEKTDPVTPSSNSNSITPDFTKYYGHVASQTAGDLKRTSDGGYIMVGSTPSSASLER